MIILKKDYLRDYVTDAFRFWAVSGFPTYDAAKKAAYEKALTEYTGDDPEKAVLYAEEFIDTQSPELLDIFAASETIRLLKEYNRSDVAEAVMSVYCVSHGEEKLNRGEISRRVTAFSLSYHAGEATVYRWLRYARALFASLRGLRLTESERERYLS